MAKDRKRWEEICGGWVGYSTCEFVRPETIEWAVVVSDTTDIGLRPVLTFDLPLLG